MWVIDTCVILDVFEGDPQFGRVSAELLEALLPQRLTISPITMVELSAAFSGDIVEQKRFLSLAGIDFSEPWTVRDTEAAHLAWNDYIQTRRADKIPKRPVADLLIGGFARNRTGLVTRNGGDFKRWFPGLVIRDPSEH